jgi:uncharacterized protein (DUF3084 family)
MFVPSLVSPLAERFQYGGLSAISSDELLDALDELERVKGELEDAQCKAFAMEEERDEAQCALADAESKVEIFTDRFDKIKQQADIVAQVLVRLRYDYPDLDEKLTAEIDEALGKIDDETFY